MTQLDVKQAKKAISALFKYNESNQNNDLLETDEDNGIYVEINTHKIMNKAQLKKKKVDLPISPYPEHIEICYITKDDEKKVEEKVKSGSITQIKKVINVNSLATTYKAYEARRKLADSYDVFLVDDRVVQLMPTLLGKSFFAKNKAPITVKSTGSLKNHVENALKATYVKLNNGTLTRVLIGNFALSQADVLKNYQQAIPEIVKITAHDWSQVEIFGIKSNSSPLLPIYTAFPKGDEVKAAKPATTTTTTKTKKATEAKKSAEVKTTPKKAAAPVKKSTVAKKVAVKKAAKNKK